MRLFWVGGNVLMTKVTSDRPLEVDSVQVQGVKWTRTAGPQVGNDMTFVHFSPLKLSGRQQLQRRKVDKSHVNDLSAAGRDLRAGCTRIGNVSNNHVTRWCLSYCSAPLVCTLASDDVVVCQRCQRRCFVAVAVVVCRQARFARISTVAMGRFCAGKLGSLGGCSSMQPPAALKRPACAGKFGSSGGSSTQPAPKYNIAVPSKLQATLDSWGPKMVHAVAACSEAWCRDVGVSTTCALRTRPALRVGTDCSGAEAPIWALHQMNIPHQHKFSCDWNASVREFIAAVRPPAGPIFVDMLKRNIQDIPDVDMYVAGFPCTPFSMLRRHNSRLLQEAAAKPFKKLLEVLAERKPALAVLENVMGIKKVMKQVCQKLVKLGCYIITITKIDSVELGVPVRRPRYYFVLVRKDVAITTDTARLKSLGKAIVGACRRPVEGTIVDLMLPPSTTPAKGRSTSGGRDVGASGQTSKWPRKHAAFRQKMGVGQPRSYRASDALGLKNERQRDAWQLLADAHPGKNIIADVSQSVERSSVSTNGVCPTVRPNSLMCVMAAGRSLSPMETLAIHFFPLHRMKIPTTVKPSSLAKMGGNTMHLKSVGLAMCMGLAMVSLPRERGAAGAAVNVGKLGRDVVFLDESDPPSSPGKRKLPRRAQNRLRATRRRIGTVSAARS